MKTIKSFFVAWLASLLAFASLSALYSCEQKNVEPVALPLSNQISYCDTDTLDVLSAIFDVTDDGYVFYLSPEKGVSVVEDILKSPDCLVVSVAEPSGQVDVFKDVYSVSFRDIEAYSQSQESVSSISMSVSFAGSLKLDINIETVSGKTLEVKYDGSCQEALLPELDNEYELDGVAKAITGAEVATNVPGDYVRYLFYSGSGEEAGMEIRVADGYDVSDLDLSSADCSKLSVSCEGFDGKDGLAGRLQLDLIGGDIILELDAEAGGKRLRASFSGKALARFESADYMSVTGEGVEERSDVGNVFRYAQSGTNTFAMGLVDAETPEGLMEGAYAVCLRVGNLSLGETIDIAADASRCSFALYEYGTYKVRDINAASGEGATGHITVAEDEGRYYVGYKVIFKDGVEVEGEWTGVPVEVAEDIDIVPIEPFVSKITVTSPSGEKLVDWDITSVELRHDTEFRDTYTGDIIPSAYIFYFLSDYSTSVEDATTTPVFILPDEYVGCENLDLKAEGDKIKWSFKFTNSNLSQYSGYGYNSSWAKRCPDEATLSVTRDDKEWTFVLMIKDYGQFGYSQSGTNNVLRVEWKGRASRYSGSKNNDMGDDEY